jgi:ribonuclease P protein component
MFPKNQRITDKKDFDLIFKKGKRYYSPFFGIRIIKNDLDTQRFAVLVSKKVSKKAVERNRTKRVIRETIKANISLFPKKTDTVFYVTPKALNISLDTTQKEIQKMLK